MGIGKVEGNGETQRGGAKNRGNTVVSQMARLPSGGLPVPVILRHEEPARRRRTGQEAGRCLSGETISSGI